MAERLRQDPLPPPWSYGVMRDGRIFFINEENSDTTWLHPVTGKAIATGFSDRNDLPQGWQEGVTASGRTYYI
ncbi:putative pleckstrin-likey domain-containing family A member 7-like, partial [Apostichopus japonicus]